jgi:excisionase family DNA binding protein
VSPRPRLRAPVPVMLTTSEAAAILRVSPRTVNVYAAKGWLPYGRTIGGHRRFPEDRIREIAAAMDHPAATPGR